MASGRRSRSVGWHPISRRPRRAGRVLVYCPGYAFQPIRAIASDLLPWVKDATHWCHYVHPYPTPP